MKRFDRLIEISKSIKPKAQTGKFFHVSFVMKGGKILHIGVNNYDKRNNISNKYKRFKETLSGAEYIAGIHSEVSALSKFKYVEDVSNLVWVNVRINNTNGIECSCPCPNCARFIKEMGIKKVYFSEKSGLFSRFSLNF
jgi:deoxycytidylate deaminase